MSDHQARLRAVYDHTEDDQRPGRRRRQAADWGVGEEIFDHMPTSRRFARRVEEHQIPRGGVDDGRRTIIIERDDPAPTPVREQLPVREPLPDDEAFASREEALRARRVHEALWDGEEPFADEPAVQLAADVESEADAPVQPVDLPPSAALSVPADDVARGGVEGRRTVKIGGRPGDLYGSGPERRRPSRTVHERLGPRPDRIAAWACALGVLLILIAILTQ